MKPDPDQGIPLTLGAHDAAAVDSLSESGLDPARTPGEHQERAGRIARLLGLLGRGGPVADRALGDVTFARVMKLHGADAGDHQHREAISVRVAAGPSAIELSTKDDEALESWVMHGYDAERVASSLRPRARKHEALAALATRAPRAMGTSADLVGGTLARIEAEIGRQREAFSFDGALQRRRRGMRIADLASLAAVLVIGAAVVWPVMGAMREQSRRAVCRANLSSTATAMASYAGSNRDSLPMATASLGGGQWWDVGSHDGHANSANLYTLVRDGYTTLANLACPGNPNAARGECDRIARDWGSIEEVSYSMQLAYGPQRRTWDAANAQPVLADRSPVVLAAIRQQVINPLANAPNHRAQGQCVLYTDGSVRWFHSPLLPNGDNIWLPRAVENRIEEIGRQLPPGSLSGRELPDGADDTVLGP